MSHELTLSRFKQGRIFYFLPIVKIASFFSLAFPTRLPSMVELEQEIETASASFHLARLDTPT
ncbi:hypothetical protein [Scytonema millei]|uniref:Uncharacterized protein n=1 Tax=Scytonema millei VB511283 TaxID=1245923 RepID=A0A9X5E8J6_9CYAN|nr:hypothetical protein [Scytonema millei]NHC37285.1 hypothetical protein [Scytonema millei VB511283]